MLRTVLSLMVVVVAVAALAVWLVRSPDAASTAETSSSAPARQPATASADRASASGASASASGTEDAASADGASATDDAATAPPESPIGRLPSIAKNANRQVASVAEALETGKHPERLNVLMAPPPFDAEAYARDPDKYLNTVVPSRAFTDAPADADVPDLVPLGQVHHTLTQGEQLELRVQAVPNAPVSWHALGMGDVGNGLTSTTVAADDAGIARITYTATTGTKGPAQIMVASPLTRGVASFHLQIQLQNESLTTSQVTTD